MAVHGVNFCAEVEKDEKLWRASISSHQPVIVYPDQGSVHTVARAETRMELLIQTVFYEMVVELGRNYLTNTFDRKGRLELGR